MEEKDKIYGIFYMFLFEYQLDQRSRFLVRIFFPVQGVFND